MLCGFNLGNGSRAGALLRGHAAELTMKWFLRRVLPWEHSRKNKKELFLVIFSCWEGLEIF